MKESFVAINIIKNGNFLLNDGGYPIIFYWDGESDIIKDIKGNEKFKNLIKENCLTDKYNYTGSYVKFLYLNNIEEVKYVTKDIPVQSLYPLYEVESQFWLDYIFDILVKLYKGVYKKDFLSYNTETNKSMLIPYLYKEIKSCTNKEILDQTITNYILNQLIEDKTLSKENIDYIIKYLNIKES